MQNKKINTISGIAILLAIFSGELFLIHYTLQNTLNDLSFSSNSQLASVSSSIDQGLTAYFTFDEGSGTTAGDSSGNGNTATISGATWVAGESRSGLNFDGANTAVSAANDSIGTGDATISAWINPATIPYIGIVASNNSNGFLLFISSSNNLLACSNDSNHTVWGSPNSIGVNNWQFVTAVRKSDGTCTLYVNAVQVASGNGGTVVAGNTLFIGRRPAPAYWFNGVIDDVRIYNRALSPAEITSLYNLNAPPDVSPPVITNISMNPLSTEASINWTTNETATTQIDYGLTSSYGNSTSLNSTLTTSHSQTLTNLQANTTYHARLRSKDATGNEGFSSDQTFLTPPAINRVGTTIYAASCNQTDVQAAINGAIDGDTVLMPAGTCTWTGIIIDNKQIILLGAGIDHTVIHSSAVVGVSTNKPFRISGMTFDGDFGGISIIKKSDWRVPLKGWRIDHVRFAVPNGYQGGGSIFIKGAFIYGVIDHCVFDATAEYSIFVAVHVYAYMNDSSEAILGEADWSVPLSLGSDNAVYIEDSSFQTEAVNAGFLQDMNFGGRMVIRHNFIRNGFVQTHAGGHGGRGGGSYEIYDNTFISDNESFRPGQIRSGTGVIFNNTISGNWDVKDITIDNVRTSTSNGGYGLCHGTEPVDGNTPGQMGWPCMDQIGRAMGGSLQHQPSSPMYSWNNTGFTHGILLIDYWGTTNPSQADHVKEGRDYFNNTPMPGYTPYVYPHPLVSGAPPPPPPLVGGGGGSSGGGSSHGGGGGSGGGPTPPPPTSVPGCTPGNLFSTVTGQRCSSTIASVPGCIGANLFSTETGQRCPTSTYPSQGSGPVGSTGSPQAFSFTRDLTLGSRGNDVKGLQQFLIFKTYLSAGNDTGYFGPLTRAALILYQNSMNITPAVGYFGPLTRAAIMTTTIIRVGN